MPPDEFDAGPNQTIVVYVSADLRDEINPSTLLAEVAQDAAERAGRGQRIVSMSAIPLRHAQGLMAMQGSGYETKVALVVVYAA